VSILIVGASVAGIRTAQALRQRGYPGLITLLGDELHHPYDKPPLSKDMLAASGGRPVALLTEDELAALGVDLKLGVRATRLDPSARFVEGADGRRYGYDHLVLATGVVPRLLPGMEVPGAVPRGVHTIRTADDALALRAALADSPDVVVVGAGFIGAEFASAARAYGCSVAVVEMQDVPMAHLLGVEVGGLLAQLHAAHGAALHTSVGFDHFEGDGQVRGIALTDGRILSAGLVVVGVGAVPATDWLAMSGLPIDNGVECDETLRVVGFPDIHAAGDVARWPHPLYGLIRIEHWTNAQEHAVIVAADILGDPRPAPQVPYVWSDQYGHRIQMLGRPSLGSLSALQGTAEDRLVATYADESGVLVGAVVVDDPRTTMKLRKAMAKRLLAADLPLPTTSGAY